MARSIKRITCTCGFDLWDEHPPSDGPPPGANIICVYCGEVYRLDDDLRPQRLDLKTAPMPVEERAELYAQQVIARMNASRYREEYRKSRKVRD